MLCKWFCIFISQKNTFWVSKIKWRGFSLENISVSLFGPTGLSVMSSNQKGTRSNPSPLIGRKRKLYSALVWLIECCGNISDLVWFWNCRSVSGALKRFFCAWMCSESSPLWSASSSSIQKLSECVGSTLSQFYWLLYFSSYWSMLGELNFTVKLVKL